MVADGAVVRVATQRVVFQGRKLTAHTGDARIGCARVAVVAHHRLCVARTCGGIAKALHAGIGVF